MFSITHQDEPMDCSFTPPSIEETNYPEFKVTEPAHLIKKGTSLA